MQIAFCENCGKHTGHKRSIGVGTALGAVVTGGASLLAVPAYGKRCIVCGLTVEQANALSPAVQAKRAEQKAKPATSVETVTFWVALAICAVVVIAIFMSNR
jgi:hypothetical protein